MSNQGRSARGRLRASFTVPSFAGWDRGAGILAGEAKRPERRENPNEPERGGRAGGLASLAAFPERTRAVRIRTNPSVGEIQTLHTIVLVGGGALDWWNVP
jgi:hypothetical protein